jgi:menaquinone-9 beta-reductase
VTYDALVIGAGPAGSTTALMLAKAGWSVAIVEKAMFPRRKVCGEFISAASLSVLRELGVGELFHRMAGPEVRRVGLFAKEEVLASPMPKATGSLDQWGRALGREYLDQLLLAAAVKAGATPWQPWGAAELRRRNQDYTCKIVTRGSEKELAARAIIGAYGSWPGGALPMPRFQPHKPADLLAFKAHFTGSELPVDLMPLLVFPGGYGGMVHSDNGRVTLSCCIRRDRLSECRLRHPGQPAGESVLRHIETSCVGVRQALERARLDGAWLSAGPIRPGIRQCASQRVFLVGNIAGEAHPIIAEGISMAIQSAWLLCRHLIASQDKIGAERNISQIERDYAADWETWFGTRVRLAAGFAHLTMRPMTSALLVSLVQQLPSLLSFGAHLSGKTSVPSTFARV